MMSGMNRYFLVTTMIFLLVGCGRGTQVEPEPESSAEVPVEPVMEESEQRNEIVGSVRAVARSWVEEQSPTYVFDGFDLQFDGLRAEGDRFILTYNFSSRHAGYGERSGKILATIITPHTIEIQVEGDTVISAITDGTHDELEAERSS
jgi:hypothetical protein